jgi:hypothetical protein
MLIMNTKKIVLIAGLVLLAIAFVSADPLMFGLCQNVEVYNEVMRRCVNGALLPEYVLQLGGFFSLSILLLSLITYKMRDEVFRAWWNFARWWVLVIIAVTYLLENAGGGGTLGMDTDFTIFALSILYAVLIITSLVKIVRTYLKTRQR